MRPLPSRPRQLGLTLIILLFSLLWTTAASAGDSTVIWVIDEAPELGSSDAKRFRNELMRTVSRAEEEHLLTRKAIAARMKSRSLQIPPCFEGQSECGPAPQQLVELFGVQGVVVATLGGGEGTWEITLDYYRELGGTPKHLEKKGDALPELVQGAVSEVFTLESVLTVTSSPEGAILFVNGHLIGSTPTQASIGEGDHVLRLEAEGYEPYREEVRVGAGEERPVEAILTPELTQITVITRAEGAQVYVDDKHLGPAGEPLDVLPGQHVVELRADGYRPIDITFEIQPAQHRTIPLAMLKKVEDPSARREAGIRKHRLTTWAQANLLFQDLSLSEVGATLGQDSLRLVEFDGGDAASLSSMGVEVGISYSEEIFGLQLISLGFGSASYGDRMVAQVEGEQRREALNGDDVFLFSVNALQGTARWLQGPFGVQGVTGFGISYASLDATSEPGGDALTFSDWTVHWKLGAEARYYWAEEWYANLGYQVEVGFSEGHGPKHGLFAGVGFNLPVLLDEGERSDGPETLEDEALGEEVAPAEDEGAGDILQEMPDEAARPAEEAGAPVPEEKTPVEPVTSPAEGDTSGEEGGF